jgi:hypothetical protein
MEEEFIWFYIYLLFFLSLEAVFIYLICTEKNKFMLVANVVASVVNLLMIYIILEIIFTYNLLLKLDASISRHLQHDDILL